MNDKTIYLDGTANAFVPEVRAYKRYLEELGYRIIFHDGLIRSREYLAVIKFPSTRLTGEVRADKVIVDFNSLSIGQFGRIKDVVKQIHNLKYSKIFFLNSYVRDGLPLLKGKKYLIRDMGCSSVFFDKPLTLKKEFDVCYIGSIDDRPGLKQAIIKLIGLGFSVCVMGVCNSDTKKLLQRLGVRFKPAGSEYEVRRVLEISRFGLNFIPDMRPFNGQTSTKLLEYCAFGLPVISNKYSWVEDFCVKYGIYVVWLDDISNILNVDRCENSLPSGEFEWNAMFDRIGLERFILC